MIKVKFKSKKAWEQYGSNFTINKQVVKVIGPDDIFEIDMTKEDFEKRISISKSEVYFNGDCLKNIKEISEPDAVFHKSHCINDFEYLEIVSEPSEEIEVKKSKFFKFGCREAWEKYSNSWILNQEVAKWIKHDTVFEVKDFVDGDHVKCKQIFVDGYPLTLMTSSITDNRIVFTKTELLESCVETTKPDKSNSKKVIITAEYDLNISGKFNKDQIKELIETLGKLL